MTLVVKLNKNTNVSVLRFYTSSFPLDETESALTKLTIEKGLTLFILREGKFLIILFITRFCYKTAYTLLITFISIFLIFSDNLGIKNIMETPFGHFIVNIGVFDLNPKPLSAIRRHCKRNKDILQAYERSHKNR